MRDRRVYIRHMPIPQSVQGMQSELEMEPYKLWPTKSLYSDKMAHYTTAKHWVIEIIGDQSHIKLANLYTADEGHQGELCCFLYFLYVTLQQASMSEGGL